jgi:hypothetical protein
MAWFKRVSACLLVAALALVPAVGRARQRVDLPNAKPRLSAPYRSIDVKSAQVLVAPDSAPATPVEPDKSARHFDSGDPTVLPPAPDVSDRGMLRGPPAC